MSAITVFFRFDDFSETSPVAVETGLVEALRRNGLCATFGVIPAVTEGSYHVPGQRATVRLGAEKTAFLRRAIAAGSIDVALHGWDHRSRSSTSPHSELRGVELHEQISRIKNGQEQLRQALNVDVSVFVPPWNSYDGNTLEALIQQGFTCISADRYGPSRHGILRFIPTTTDVRNVRRAVVTARQSKDPSPIVGVLLHPYDFEESLDPRGDLSCAAFDADLHWLTEQPDVRVVCVSQLSREDGTLATRRYRANAPLTFESIFPPFVSTTAETPYYRSAAAARRVKALKVVVTVATYIWAVCVGSSVAYRIGTALDTQAGFVTVSRFVIGAILLAVLARIVIRRRLYFRAMLTVAILTGMLISLFGEPS